MAIPQDTIIIAEEDRATIETLKRLLKAQGFSVVQFENQQTLLETGDFEGLACVLILGDIGGVEFLEKLRSAGCEMPVIFLRSNGSIKEAVKAIRAGADDYVSKPFCPDTLLVSIKHSMEKARERVQVEKSNQVLHRKAASLTQREHEIIHLVLSGMLNKQIAEQLGLALVTVKVHRGNAMRKLGARTAGELARIAREAGITLRHNNSPPTIPPTGPSSPATSFGLPG